MEEHKQRDHTSTTSQQPLSKRQLKKQKRTELWEAKRDERKQIRKEKKIQKREEKRKRKESDENDQDDDASDQPEPKRRIRPSEQTPSPLRVVVDCDFESYMIDKEIKSTASQLARCYSQNRATVQPVHLFATSFKSKVRDSLSVQFAQWNAWKMVFDENCYSERFAKGELVYLTADSQTTLETLDESKVYIIGGIVDKNRHKNLCHERATKLGIATARLPISEYVQLSSRKVLTINHVFEIMIKYLESKNWKEAFLSVIPARKGVTDKVSGDSTAADDGTSDNAGTSAVAGEEEGEEEEEANEERLTTAATPPAGATAPLSSIKASARRATPGKAVAKESVASSSQSSSSINIPSSMLSSTLSTPSSTAASKPPPSSPAPSSFPSQPTISSSLPATAHEPVLEAFVNNIMKHGKKATARRIIKDALDHIQKQVTSTNPDVTPHAVFAQAVEKAEPLMKLVGKKRGAKSIQTPTPLNERQRRRQAILWIVEGANTRSKRDSMGVRIGKEIVSIHENEPGSSVLQKKLQLHKTVLLNRSNVVLVDRRIRRSS